MNLKDILQIYNMSILFIEIIISIILIFLIIKCEWIIKTIREICKEPEGYIKLIQTTFFLFAIISFSILLFYFIIKPNSTDKLDIFLTIIVGFLGTMIGFFFSDRAMEKISKDIKGGLLDYLDKTTHFLKEVKKKKN